ELPDAIGAGIGSEEAARRARWRRVVVDVVGDREFLVHGYSVGTHGVMDPGAPPGVEAAVVARIVPGEHLWLHRLRISLLVVLDDPRHLWRVDGDGLAVRLEYLGAEGPGDGPKGGVCVDTMADLDPHGVADLL